MKISATGWNRDMGPTVIGEFDLASVTPKESAEKFSFDGIGFYNTTYPRGAALYWGKSLKLTGNYKLRLELTASDIRKLFWEVHGPLLTADLVEHFGFVVYKDLKEKILREIKLSEFMRDQGVELADITLGDLIDLKAQRSAKGDKAAAA
jgi:hypothetical protein